MNIHFLGTSHGICEKDRHCSCAVLTVGNRRYLIDAGAPITDILPRENIPYDSIKGIFITHNHFDHMVGLVHYTGNLDDFNRFEGIRNDVYVPHKQVYRNMYRLLFGWKIVPRRVKFHRYRRGVIFDDGFIKVTAYRVRHILFSYAFMIEGEGKRVLFSGDLSMGMRDLPKVLWEQEFDALVLEGAHTVLNGEDLLSRLRGVKTKRLIINHLYEKKNSDEVLQETFAALPDKECLAAFDGLKMDL